MTLSDIDPFVRGVSSMRWNYSNTEYSIGYDCRLFMIADGQAKFLSEGKEYLLGDGSIALINTGLTYRLESVDARSFTLYIVNFDLTQNHTEIGTYVQPGKESNYDKSKVIERIDLPELREALVLRDGAELSGRVKEMFFEYHSGLPHREKRLSAMLADLIIRASRMAAGGDSRRTLLVGEIKRCIHEHYRQKLTNEIVAAKLGYHPYYLARIFREETGTTMHRYLHDFRLTAAAEALASLPSASIESVAADCGFATAAHFTAAFKKKFGRLPSSVRG